MELVRKLKQLQEERVHAYRMFEEGHKIYLSSGPNYNFAQFRTLVNDVTQDFKRISEEVIQIECALRTDLHYPKLANIVAGIQDSEKAQLQLMAQLQLVRQDLQDNFHDEGKAALLNQHVNELEKNLVEVRANINDNLQEIIYLTHDLGV